MAARENQGLQISLIIFVMLTMILAVTTYLFFHNFQEEQVKVAGLTTNINTANADKQKLLENWAALKKLHAGPATEEQLPKFEEVADETTALVAEFEAAIKKYRPDLKESDKDRRYPFLVDVFYTELNKKNNDLEAAKVQIETLTKDIGLATVANTQEVKNYNDSMAKHNVDLTGERTRYNGEVKNKHDQMEALSGAKNAAEQLVNKIKQEGSSALDALKGRLAKLETDNKKLAEERNEKKTQVTESPQGMVLYINQSNRTATINLGALDGLRKQTVFSVYAATDLNVAKARAKGKLEVIQIESGHSATCRILEDELKNPLMPKDLVYSPIWQPGQIEHFALAGIFDIDGDGRSDRQLLVDLINSNGGVVDSQLDEKGKIDGKISLNTQFLIVGDRPTERTGNPEVAAGFTRMLNDADKLGVQQMPLNKFLLHVGYTPERSGKGGSAAPIGASTGDTGVDSGFRPRTPPKGAGGGAFDK